MKIHTFPFQCWDSISKRAKTSYLIMLNYIELITTFSYQSTLYRCVVQVPLLDSLFLFCYIYSTSSINIVYSVTALIVSHSYPCFSN